MKYRADVIVVREHSNILVYIVRILLCVTHWFATESIFLFQGKPASVFTTDSSRIIEIIDDRLDIDLDLEDRPTDPYLEL